MTQNVPITILIIADTTTSTQSLIHALRAWHFTVFSTKPGAEAFDVIRSRSPDVIILDTALSTERGLKLCREIRAFTQIPLLMLSTVDKPGVMEHALDAGADKYLSKPLQLPILIAHIRTLSRRAAAERQAARLQSSPR